MPHRPLSFWISTVDFDDAPIEWGPHIPTNDGDERSDARHWPRFKDPAWQRISVPVSVNGIPAQALGLRHGNLPEVVVELDDFSSPIPIAAAALPIVNHAEDTWPQVELTASELEVLSGESRALRYYFVARLAADGEPGPQVYSLLPWELLDGFCEALGDLLSGTARARPQRLRHWFNPAGSLVAPALEQIYEGLVTGDDRTVRQGATAFCTTLLELDPARVPPPSRRLLAGIALRLAARDRLLQHVGRRAAARITDEEQPHEALRLSSRLRSAAASTADNSFSATLDADPFTLTTTVRTGGRLTIVVSAALSDDEYEQAIEQYDAIIVTVTMTDGGRHARFYLPVGRGIAGYSALLRTQIRADSVQLTLDGPPLGAAEVLSLPPGDVLPSLTELDLAGARAWSPVARAAAPGHPLRNAINTWLERFGL